jgi:hypothetical protein
MFTNLAILGVFQKWRYPGLAGWMVYFMENTQMDDLGVPLFQEITMCIYCIPKGVVKQQKNMWGHHAAVKP